jgi:hypothetical protein
MNLKIIIWIWKVLFEYEFFYLNSKSLFDLKIDIWILNHYFKSKI